MAEKFLKKTALFQKNFLFFIFGYFLSAIGSQIQTTGQMWLVYKLTNSPFYLGLFSFITSCLAIFSIIVGGILIDLFNRKYLLLLTNLFGMLFSFVLGVLIHLNKINFWYLTFLVFLYNFLNTFEIPLRQVFVSEILPLFLITKGVAFQSLSFNFARLIGPFLGGLILTYSYAYNCFYLNALSFFVFAILISLITPEFRRKDKDFTHANLKNFIKSTLSFLKMKKINYVLLAVVIYTFFGNSIVILFPFITNKVYLKDPKDFSFLLSALGLGAVFGALLIILRKEIKNELLHLWKATLILALGIAGLSFGKIWEMAKVFSFLIGFSFSNFFPVANGFLQKSVPDYLRGKIISIFTLAYLGTYPLGDLIIGALTETFTFQLVIIFYLLILLALNSFLLLNASKTCKI